MTFARAGARQECPCLRVGQGVVPQWLPRVWRDETTLAKERPCTCKPLGFA